MVLIPSWEQPEVGDLSDELGAFWELVIGSDASARSLGIGWEPGSQKISLGALTLQKGAERAKEKWVEPQGCDLGFGRLAGPRGVQPPGLVAPQAKFFAGPHLSYIQIHTNGLPDRLPDRQRSPPPVTAWAPRPLAGPPKICRTICRTGGGPLVRQAKSQPCLCAMSHAMRRRRISREYRF